MLSETLSTAELRSTIDDFNARYAQAIDDDRLEEWPQFFAEDGRYSIVPRENIDLDHRIGIIYCRNRAMMIDRVVAIRNASLYGPHRYRHIVSRSVVIPDSFEAIRAATAFVVFQIRTDPVDFGRIETYAVGEYRDVFVRTEGDLRLADRLVVLDNSTVKTLLVTPL